MNRDAMKWVGRLLFTAAGFGLVAAAFVRGDFLLGIWHGLTYALIAGYVVWLLARALILTDNPSVGWAAVVVAVAIPLGFVMAYPASINSDVQVFIDKQADDRAARAELAAVFASDPAYRYLSVSTVHLKVVNVTIHGSLDGQSDLDRLRGRIAAECPTVDGRVLHWEVVLR